MGLVASHNGFETEAEVAWNGDDVAATPAGAVYRGTLLDHRHCPKRADAYTATLDRAPVGTAHTVGYLLERRGDHELAEQAYRSGMRRGSTACAVRLGFLLVRRDDIDGAEDVLRWADDQGSADGAF